MSLTQINQKRYDKLVKIVLVGDSGSGKTSLLAKFSDNIFQESFMSTIGIDFKIRTIQTNGKIVKLQIWDTAGQERFRSITTCYYRGANAIIIVCDVTDINSFDNIEKTWLKEVKKLETPPYIVIVGTKIDKINKRIVTDEQIKTLCEKYNMPYYLISSKTNSSDDIGIIFENIGKYCLEMDKKNIDEIHQLMNYMYNNNVLGQINLKNESKNESKNKSKNESKKSFCSIL
jgi:small GTP-binding protein